MDKKIKTKFRQSNFELMRIISMFFIVLFHFIVPTGGNLLSYTTPEIKNVLIFITFIIIVHVNSFVLLTGYFGYKEKTKIKKVIYLFAKAYFYSIVIAFLFKIFKGVKIDDYLAILSPFEYQNMWFLVVYSSLYLLSPYINIVIDKLSKKDFEKLIILLLIMYCGISLVSRQHLFFNEGYSLEHFIMMYTIGAYLAKYGLPNKIKKMSLTKQRLLYTSVFIGMGVLSFLLYQTTTWIITNSHNTFIVGISDYIKTNSMNYNTPFIIIQSVAYFLLFETFQFKSKIINFLAKPVLAVYLITEQPQMINFIYEKLNINTGIIYSYEIIPKIIIESIIILLLCILIDYIRILIVKKCILRKEKS